MWEGVVLFVLFFACKGSSVQCSAERHNAGKAEANMPCALGKPKERFGSENQARGTKAGKRVCRCSPLQTRHEAIRVLKSELAHCRPAVEPTALTILASHQPNYRSHAFTHNTNENANDPIQKAPYARSSWITYKWMAQRETVKRPDYWVKQGNQIAFFAN